MDTHVDDQLLPYVPALAAEWDLDSPGEHHRRLDATLCFVDISGFTMLSEKLASRGRIGAEELTSILRRVFGSMIELALDRGGGLLKFGGDALLLVFRGDDHVLQAASAAVEMRRALRESARIETSVGRVPLKMSVGLHTGPVDLFRVGDSHRELLVAGPTASHTLRMEGTADAGEIVVSESTRSSLPVGSAEVAKGEGWLLRWRQARVAPAGPRIRRPTDSGNVTASVPLALREHLSAGEVESEHRIAVVGFVKFSGVDALLASEGPPAVAEALDGLVRATQAAVDAEQLAFLASDLDVDGGKFIITAGVPLGGEDDERRMLRAVRTIISHSTRLDVRVGVNRGHVFAGLVGAPYRSSFTVMGDTVNLAARLMAAAPPGSVYATPSVLDRSPSLFAAEALEPFEVKGKQARVQAYSVGVEIGPREDQGGDDLPFFGRSRELAAVRAARERLERDGTGGVVDIVGEAGVGKTRLVEAALEGASFARVAVRGEPYGTATPYRPFRDPLRNLLGVEATGADRAAQLRDGVCRIAPSLEPFLPLVGRVAHVDIDPTPATEAIEPEFLADRTADVVLELAERAVDGPIVVLVDDADFLDDATSHLVGRIARATRERPWLLMVSRRDEEVGPSLPDAIRMRLAPLDDATAAELVVEATAAAPLRPAEIDSIVDQADGNPLHLGELIRVARHGGTTEGIDSLESVIAAQIDALPPLSRRILRVASVLGGSARLATLRRLVENTGLVLDGATRAELGRLLREDGPGRVRFRHGLVRDAAYEGLPFARRRELHSQAARIVAEDAGDDVGPYADLLSLHHYRAGEYDAAWTHARVAGDRARATAANVAAAIHYQRALASARRLGDVDGADLVETWTGLGEAQLAAAKFDEALEAYATAARLAESPFRTAELTLRRARAHERAGRFTAALRTTTRVLSMLHGLDDPESDRLRARALAFRAVLRCAQERPRETLRLAEEAVAAARDAGEREGLAQALTMVDWAHRMLGDPLDSPRSLEALEIYRELGDLTGEANVHGNLGFELYYTGDWETALRHLQRAQDAAALTGDTVQSAMAAASVGEIQVCQNRFEDAARSLVPAARTFRAAGFLDGASFAEINLARVHIGRGELSDAIELLDAVIADVTLLGLAGSALEAAVYRAECDVLAGEPGVALERLAVASDAAGDEAAVFEPIVARVAGRAHVELGQRDEAIRRVDDGIAAARSQGLVYELATLLDARASIAGDDEAVAAEASELFARLGVSDVASVPVG